LDRRAATWIGRNFCLTNQAPVATLRITLENFLMRG
jgi:hypothetical protein